VVHDPEMLVEVARTLFLLGPSFRSSSSSSIPLLLQLLMLLILQL
jgi:hypothetical protein